MLRREKIVQADGSAVEVPVISGNSWRGQLRDCGMRAMLVELARALGVPRVTLSPQAFHLLFSGGTLGKDTAMGDIGEARYLRRLIPFLGVLGGAAGRQILEGKLLVGKIYPICRETRHVLPTTLSRHPFADISIWDFLSMEHYTRMDDSKRESLAGQFLAPADQRLLEAPKVRKTTNKRTGEVEEIAARPGVAIQMRFGAETFAAGTMFWCSVYLREATQLELESFMWALREWSRIPTLGGKSAIGLGRVRLELPGWFTADPLAPFVPPPSMTVSTDSFGDAYARHVATNAQAILAALEALP